ncbi:septum site-determining protein MinC [Clostridium botulinum C]|uniref:Probable septum site-determining protein MinC n=2 Tax=Clostridium botulinum TaxID=1491 RepID=A0A9Q4XUB1_CLOBO|nr:MULTISPECIES: septum site-determining protein MinC [Clostridium]KEI06563.1 septation inhibitor protein [Clostridium sp. K25]MCD3193861.1 septum site-determining protein MinC [Clostridium botulinum C]MCD3199929.1 septum site-determining protein MinC [Clostridium botulinum C]MCD3205404.1 septum site-determining protein MinC [Clostridium botulinum C]MCD3207330.1 septum site-determining protein MinC [Clostridium botulinum C]
MVRDRILVKGNRDGLNIIIDMNKFQNFDEMIENFIKKLSIGKKFYKGSTIIITTQLKEFNEKQIMKFEQVLFEDFFIKDCIFQEMQETKSKIFTGVYEGRTKFYRRTLRSGQIIRYPGNIVIVGDTNPGSEVYAGGNVIVIGNLCGDVHAGESGNKKAIIAAFRLQPNILQISNIMTRSPEDGVKPSYPEVARIKDGIIIVEPYLPNKFV